MTYGNLKSEIDNNPVLSIFQNIQNNISSNGGDFMQATKNLDNDQIKGLPTSPIEVIPAPGLGKMIVPIMAVFTTNIQVIYENIVTNPSNAYEGTIYLVWDALNNFNDAICAVNVGLDQTGRRVSFGNPVTGNLLTLAAGGQLMDYGTYGDVTLGYENAALYVVGQNTGGTPTHDFTAGDAANTMKINIIYATIDL